jgi:plasmid stabilization system protein ParE
VDYRLLFTQRALNDLAEIIGHIAEEDDDAASRFGNALLDHVDLLTRFSPHGKHCSKTLARSQVAATAFHEASADSLPKTILPTIGLFPFWIYSWL